MNYSKKEILHFALRWIYNFREGDLQKAHADYHAGPDYHWQKFQGKFSQGMNACQAMIEVVLNMDKEGQNLLINWILKENEEEIKFQRDWDLVTSKE